MIRTAPATLTDSFSWDSTSGDAGSALLHLVICWSLDEPDRIGEAAPIRERCILGRGGPDAQDPAPRVIFYRQRPEGSEPTPPLMGSRVSRVQLELTPDGRGRLAVRSVGRCSMLVGGNVVERAELQPGDTLVLRNGLVLLVVMRSPLRDALHRSPSPTTFQFGGPDPNGIIGESPAAHSLRSQLGLAAQLGQHALVLGESGTGKELAARALHALSPRSGGAFVARNAATLPEGLVDAELFGTAKGYPNAGTPERPGLIAEADGGTLFLDEVGELPTHLSSHLLRVLDRDGEYQRLGETRIRRSALRVVAATNRPLEHLKHDFAARFAVRVRVPGLQERREDIPLLLRHLLVRAAQTTRNIERIFERRSGALGEPRIDSLLVEALVRHRYTHHLRELERLMWIALSTSQGSFLALTPEISAELRLAAAPESAAARRGLKAAPSRASSPSGTKATATPGDTAAGSIGRSELEAALAEANGNVTEAAHRLGLKNRFALYRLIRQHGLAPPVKDGEEA